MYRLGLSICGQRPKLANSQSESAPARSQAEMGLDGGSPSTFTDARYNGSPMFILKTKCIRLGETGRVVTLELFYTPYGSNSFSSAF